jgi:large subunit ribosomal protein L13
MKTFSAKASEVQRQWWLIDAADQVLGRVAVKAANLLRGKEKPVFTSHVDTGDFVIVINAEKVKLTGRKLEQKRHFRHTGYMGHERYTPVKKLIQGGRPERVIEHAVFGMLPKNSLSRQKLRGKLKVYAGENHPHAAQQPAAYSVTPLQRNA